jgi:hypothetical protein
VFIRVYNGTDQQKEASIFVDDGVTHYAFTNGLMEPEQDQKVSGVLRLKLEPYAVRGIKFYYGQSTAE